MLTQASHSAAPGKLGLQLALVLPPGAGAPLVLPGGGALAQSADGSGVGVSWPGAGRLRRVLTGPEARALLVSASACQPRMFPLCALHLGTGSSARCGH